MQAMFKSAPVLDSENMAVTESGFLTQLLITHCKTVKGHVCNFCMFV